MSGAEAMAHLIPPLIPAQAEIQGRLRMTLLGPRLRGDERPVAD
jgi:hypothetical protein